MVRAAVAAAGAGAGRWVAGAAVVGRPGAAAIAGAAARGAAAGAGRGAAAGAAEGAPVGPPGGSVGSLIVGAAEGFGGNVMRTVSFLGATLPVVFFPGSRGAPGTLGGTSAIVLSKIDCLRKLSNSYSGGAFLRHV